MNAPIDLIKNGVSTAITSILAEPNDLALRLSKLILREEKIETFIVDNKLIMASVCDDLEENDIYLTFLNQLQSELEKTTLSIEEKEALKKMIDLTQRYMNDQDIMSQLEKINENISELSKKNSDTGQEIEENKEQIKKASKAKTNWAISGVLSSTITLALIVLILMTLPHSIPIVVIGLTVGLGVIACASWARTSHFSTRSTALLKENQDLGQEKANNNETFHQNKEKIRLIADSDKATQAGLSIDAICEKTPLNSKGPVDLISKQVNKLRTCINQLDSQVKSYQEAIQSEYTKITEIAQTSSSENGSCIENNHDVSKVEAIDRSGKNAYGGI